LLAREPRHRRNKKRREHKKKQVVEEEAANFFSQADASFDWTRVTYDHNNRLIAWHHLDHDSVDSWHVVILYDKI
jgi:hypothetical protein